jgi:nicotinate-nucleotide adenylyltransferase
VRSARPAGGILEATAQTFRWIHRAPLSIWVQSPPAPRLGVLSGTFNPPTCGHLAVGAAALEQLGLHEVLFVLPEQPPHRHVPEASLEQRAAMLRAAVAAEPRFSAAVTRGGLLLDIHEAIRAHYPAATTFVFLVGRDAAERILLRWPYPDLARALAEMFARFELGVADRQGPFRLPSHAPAAAYASRIHRLQIPATLEVVSASRVRERIARGESVAELLPAEVEAFIRSQGLYRTPEACSR